MQAGPHEQRSGVALDAETVAAGATATADIDTAGFLQLTVLAELDDAGASALTLSVRPYLPDGTTVHRQTLEAATSEAAALASGTPDSAVLSQTFDLRGVAKVQVAVTNSDSFGSKAATVSYFLLD